MQGMIHSIESFGTVDGPGVRMVVFLKGCPMRCLYCHNPDTWNQAGATPMEASEIIERFELARHFYSNGGITVTGGEPLVQIDFVISLFELARSRGIHTCLDTSGTTFRPDSPALMAKMDRLAAVTDLVMLDIKHIDPVEHQKLCGRPLSNILQFARYLDRKHVPMWIRHVVVPGITQNDGYLYRLGQFVGELHHVEALDVLPYHDMGKVKYQKLGMEYPLKDTAPLSQEDAIKAKKIIMKGIKDTKLARTN